MKPVFVIFLNLLLFISSTCGQPTHETVQRIENYLAELEKIGFYGSVLVEFNGEKIISKGYGFRDRENQLKNSPNTIFDIGSITKQFTAAAILKLEMEGKLSTDDKISEYFNDIPSYKATITLHDLLRHQSGLIGNVGSDYEKISQEEFLKKVLSSKLKSEPGKSFSYSNIGYSLLAMIIEKVSGKTYEAYLYENLWKPASMEMTGYTRPVFDKSLIAVGYARDTAWGKPNDKEWDGNAPYWHLKGNGGILSTTEDLYNWDKALKSKRILSETAKQKLFHPKLRADEKENSYYAYGWDVSKTSRNTTQIWHNGSNRIFYADFLRYPDENVTLIMLSNKFHQDFNPVNREISGIIFTKGYTPEIPAEDNKINRDFTSKILETIQNSGLEAAKKEYLSKDAEVHLLEFKMRNQGFQHIDNNKPDVAIQIFEMNVFAYPNSAKALQGLGEGYMETGNKELALKYFNQSLRINPENNFVKDMIQKLEE